MELSNSRLQKIGCEAFTCDPASIDYTDNERISIRSGSLIIKNADGSISSVLPSRDLCIITAAGSKWDNECVYIAQNKLSETILRLPQSDRERYELSAHDSNEAAQIAVYMSGVSRNETVNWNSTAFNPHEIIEAIMNILQHEKGAEVYCYESNATGANGGFADAGRRHFWNRLDGDPDGTKATLLKIQCVI